MTGPELPISDCLLRDLLRDGEVDELEVDGPEGGGGGGDVEDDG